VDWIVGETLWWLIGIALWISVIDKLLDEKIFGYTFWVLVGSQWLCLFDSLQGFG
jgi:hypothetical protein